MNLKITDFGFACVFNPKEGLQDVLGSPLYMAPEIIKETKYDNRVDVWSCGVIAYILLCGRPPFRGKAKPDIFKSILNNPLDFEHPIWDKVSKASKDFIRKCLDKDFNKRPQAKDLLEHEWFMKQVK